MASVAEPHQQPTSSIAASDVSRDDLHCIARMAAGDVDRLGDLYDRHGGVLYSLALRILGCEVDAAAVVIDVFAQSWRDAARYQARQGTVRVWLLALTRERAIERRRAMDTRFNATATDRSVSTATKASNAPERVRQVLDSLPDVQRVAIQKIYFEGMTLQESVHALRAPLDAVKAEIRSGLQKLRAAARWEEQ